MEYVGDHNLTSYNRSKTSPHGVMSKAIKDLNVSSSSPIGLRWNNIAYGPTNDIRAKVMGSSHGSVIVRKGLLGDHNLTLYNHSKNRLAWCDVENHKRFKCIIFIINWF